MAEKPGEVKKFRREISDSIKTIWDEKKFEIVKAGNIHKFSQHEDLKRYLLGTSDCVMVEASPTDKICGIGLAQDSPFIEDPYAWTGKNLFGFALMEARDFIRAHNN